MLKIDKIWAYQQVIHIVTVDNLLIKYVGYI